MVTEKNLTECESNYLGRRDAVEFGTQFHDTAQN